MLGGNKPCLGIEEMLLRLRSRGMTALVTDHGFLSVSSIYGERSGQLLGQCGNVIILRQPDLDSAMAASTDLGYERGGNSERLYVRHPN